MTVSAPWLKAATTESSTGYEEEGVPRYCGDKECGITCPAGRWCANTGHFLLSSVSDQDPHENDHHGSSSALEVLISDPEQAVINPTIIFNKLSFRFLDIDIQLLKDL